MPLTLPARKCALFLSAFAIATAAPAISASTLLAQSAAEQVYEQPENRDVQSDLPKIPQVAGDQQTPPVGGSTETPEVAGETPEVVGEKPPVTPAAEEVPPGIEPATVAPGARPADDTLPVTGLDVLILLGAAAAAGGVGFALRRSSAR